MSRVGSMVSLAIAIHLARALSGCEGPVEPPRCVPSASEFETEIRPRLETYCGNCHGESPNFGAPVSLLDVEELLAEGMDGRRLVDGVAARLALGDMPPPGTPRPPPGEMEAVARWASCGAAGATTREGLTSSARPFVSPERAPAGTTTHDLLANGHVVTPDTRDAYVCFVSDLDIASDRFVRRFEMVFDETRVLHHLILSRDTMRTVVRTNDTPDGNGSLSRSRCIHEGGSHRVVRGVNERRPSVNERRPSVNERRPRGIPRARA
jgi:hypothetical protein